MGNSQRKEKGSLSHEHTLFHYYVENRSTKDQCDVCNKEIYGLVYACQVCKFTRHGSCAQKQMPSEITHPSHSMHELQLQDKSSDFLCERCFYNSRGPRYHCYSCLIDVDLACVSSTTNQLTHGEQGLIPAGRARKRTRHFSHGEPLALFKYRKATQRFELDCSWCDKRLSGMSYGCFKGGPYGCKFFLHESCFSKIPKRLLHPFHPLHYLFVQYSEHDYRFSCNACKSSVSTLSWTTYYACHDCRFYLHISCARLQPTFKHKCHQHYLTYFSGSTDPTERSFNYRACGHNCNAKNNREGAFYRCVQCDFNIHFRCLPAPPIAKHRYHLHFLILQHGVIEDDSGEYYCDICEEERNPKHHIYYCKECKYIAHVGCVLKEVSDSEARKMMDLVKKLQRRNGEFPKLKEINGNNIDMNKLFEMQEIRFLLNDLEQEEKETKKEKVKYFEKDEDVESDTSSDDDEDEKSDRESEEEDSEAKEEEESEKEDEKKETGEEEEEEEANSVEEENDQEEINEEEEFKNKEGKHKEVDEGKEGEDEETMEEEEEKEENSDEEEENDKEETSGEEEFENKQGKYKEADEEKEGKDEETMEEEEEEEESSDEGEQENESENEEKEDKSEAEASTSINGTNELSCHPSKHTKKSALEIHHFSHRHPLNIFHLTKKYKYGNCNACGQELLGTVYICKACEFLFHYGLHKACTELPYELLHPLHSQHSLTLLCEFPYSETAWFLCDECRDFSAGFVYLCMDCQFKLDVKCAVLAASKIGSQDPKHKEEKETKVLHFSHEHMLVLGNLVHRSVSCLGCDLPILGPAYCCPDCLYTIHESCLRILPQEMHHPFHPLHPLVAFSEYSEESKCHACKMNFHLGFPRARDFIRYGCLQCKLDLHFVCANSLKRFLKSNSHKHNLYYFGPDSQMFLERFGRFDDFNFMCSTCSEMCKGPFYRCVECSINFHLKCVPVPQKIKSKCHLHHLILKDSFIEDDIEEYFCDACEEERHPKDHVYYCEECHGFFVTHIECVLPMVEETSPETTAISKLESELENTSIQVES